MTLSIDVASMTGVLPKSGRAAMIDSYAFATEMGKIVSAINNNAKGAAWYVDSVLGSAAYDGKSWGAAKATIAQAYALAAAGDTIYMSGSFNESVTCTKSDLHFICNDDVTKECIWTAATDTFCLKISATNVRVQGIYFRPPVYTADATTLAAILLGTTASYAQIVGNRFQGQTASYNAILSPAVGADNVLIAGNEFMYLNTDTYGTGIRGVSTGGFAYSGWRILNNIFNSCVTAIKLNARCCTIAGNTVLEYGVKPATAAVASVLAMGIDLTSTSGGGGGANQVVANYLDGAYSATLYKVNADVAGSDNWNGNYCIAGTGATAGLTFANPA